MATIYKEGQEDSVESLKEICLKKAFEICGNREPLRREGDVLVVYQNNPASIKACYEELLSIALNKNEKAVAKPRVGD